MDCLTWMLYQFEDIESSENHSVMINTIEMNEQNLVYKFRLNCNKFVIYACTLMNQCLFQAMGLLSLFTLPLLFLLYFLLPFSIIT